MQEGFLAEDDFGAQDDYQRELDEEAEFEQQRLDAERRNAAENVAGITLLQEGIHKSCLPACLHGLLHVDLRQHTCGGCSGIAKPEQVAADSPALSWNTLLHAQKLLG